MFYNDRYLVRILSSIPVVIVLFIISGIVYCYHDSFITTQEPTIPLLALYILFYIDIILLCWSYISSVITDPGSIPSYFDFLSDESRIEISNNKYNDEDCLISKSSFCNKCDRNRPPRAHHCRICNRCILRMDHHCPWIGNCVGFHNYRYFIQFLIYACIGSTIAGVCCGWLAIKENEFTSTANIIGACGGIFIGLTLTLLSGFHLWLLFTNRTTLEIYSSIEFNTFDNGGQNNFQIICGNFWAAYFLPINAKNVGDGVIYPIKLREKAGGIEYFESKILK
ncbi:unnamed protein product [Blepharisma stoltei]|uniref:Palmitoyltransferase n=1 Tax=Blepharisma stoltei TaxID=1481888 RepID=A0AAU9KCS1_9CILI|nr:unnamed protein product [Blepharisma stoltei]